MIKTYYIGGSPCSGKSTIAEILSEKYSLYYFKVDDFLDKYIKIGAERGYTICKKQDSLSAEQIWMREPMIQCKEELLVYKEIFGFIMDDLKQIGCKGIVTEGAAYLPELMKQINVPYDRYLSIVPTKEFQVTHYRQREWVPYILEGCSDKEKAFCNWMDRDHLFAKEVQRQCERENYFSIVNDGNIEIEELAYKAIVHLGLEG